MLRPLTRIVIQHMPPLVHAVASTFHVVLLAAVVASIDHPDTTCSQGFAAGFQVVGNLIACLTPNYRPASEDTVPDLADLPNGKHNQLPGARQTHGEAAF